MSESSPAIQPKMRRQEIVSIYFWMVRCFSYRYIHPNIRSSSASSHRYVSDQWSQGCFQPSNTGPVIPNMSAKRSKHRAIFLQVEKKERKGGRRKRTILLSSVHQLLKPQESAFQVPYFSSSSSYPLSSPLPLDPKAQPQKKRYNIKKLFARCREGAGGANKGRAHSPRTTCRRPWRWQCSGRCPGRGGPGAC